MLEELRYDSLEILSERKIYHYRADGEYKGVTKNGVYTSYDYKDTPSDFERDHHNNWTKCIRYEDNNHHKPENIAFQEITYYGEACAETILTIDGISNDLVSTQHPIPRAPVANPFDLAQWQWIAEGQSEYEPFSVQRYYTAQHGFLPSQMRISSYETDLWSLRQYLLHSFGAAEIWGKSVQEDNRYDECHQQYVLSFPRNAYILEADNVQHNGSYHYEFAGKPPGLKAELANNVQFGCLNLYYSPSAFAARDEDFEDELRNVIASFRVKKKAETPQVSMITTMGNSFALKTYLTKDDFIIKDLDLNYGNGFEKFNDELMVKFTASTQGLILFHGEPGTGKTFYVRHLLRKMTESKKVVIYMPPNMVDHLVEPSFMTFISAQVALFSSEGKSCVMLIEDAEPLLVARDANIRIQGITNLLNMTDGLLNDMLGLQIICTFNVPLKQLDKALLRPGRLIARKEFKPLQEFEANILAHSLGIKYVFTGPATLSDIYAKTPDKKMLTHDE
ncbi:MAG: AAA family ATPase [Chitinophagaceae bacterium]